MIEGTLKVQNSFIKTRYLKCLTEETVFMYSGIKFKVEVPEKNPLCLVFVYSAEIG